MGDYKNANGQCLCGQVEIQVAKMSLHVGACHCSTCRKWGGGPYMEVNCGSDVIFEGEENIKVFDTTEWAERGFCGNCGTHLFIRLKANKEHVVPVGLFDSAEDLVFDHQVFIDEKPKYYSFSNETKNMTGPEIFAKFS